MWMLSFVPTAWIEFAIHAMLIAGVAGVILAVAFKQVPFVQQYRLPLEIAAIMLLVVGVYFKGGVGVEKEWRAKVAEMEEKIKIAEAKSAKVNTVIQTRVVERIKVVKEKANANIQIVEKIVTKYDNICTLSNAAVSLHNAASQNAVAPSTGSAVEGTSAVKASELLGTVAENYGIYHQVREQVIGWQDWYREQKKIYESVK